MYGNDCVILFLSWTEANFNNTEIEFFLAIIRYGSITQAAERLKKTPNHIGLASSKSICRSIAVPYIKAKK